MIIKTEPDEVINGYKYIFNLKTFSHILITVLKPNFFIFDKSGNSEGFIYDFDFGLYEESGAWCVCLGSNSFGNVLLTDDQTQKLLNILNELETDFRGVNNRDWKTQQRKIREVLRNFFESIIDDIEKNDVDTE